MLKNILIKIFSAVFIVLFICIMTFTNLYLTTEATVYNVAKSSSRSEITFVVDFADENEKMYFFTNANGVKVYFDDVLVESFDSDHSVNSIYCVEITGENIEVVITFDSTAGLLTQVTQVFIGEEAAILNHFLVKDILLLVVNLMMVFVAIVIVLLTAYGFVLKQRSWLVVGFSIFFLSVSLWCLVQVDFILYLFNNDVLSYFRNYCVFLFPISAALTSLTFDKSKFSKILAIVTTILFTLLGVITYILGEIGVEVILIMNFVIILLTILYFIGIMILTRRATKDTKNKFASIFINSLFICCVGFIFEVLSLVVMGITGPSGMYISICLLVVYIYSISRVVKEYIKKEDYRTYLSEENARLSSSILLSQIKPHFLYNALNSISLLCKVNPQQADMAVIRFSRYLRQNMKCIESSELVDFASEMEHIRNYVYLETIRFPKMEIVYELKYINFQVPPLCIQPIVENAVKHGVSKNSEGIGFVIIKSFITAKHIIIEVSDNGPGFDTKVNIKGTGLSNISRRLKMLIGADIEFASVVGKGTVVRVRIPREGVR
ncbi:MAG: histidine kinase [bacterium]